MAVLKDLIVHGPSRFINTAQFESLNTNKIGAEEGVFNKIIATTGDIGSLTVEDLTAGKATVLSLLDVRGELHTNQWTNSNIATIDGSFYITPTIGIPEGTMTTTANSLSVYGTNFPISSVYVNGINSDNTAGTVAWTTGSKVLITGEILVNGTYMPLGTLVGTLGSNVTASRIDIGSITDNRYQTAASLAEIGTQSTALPCRNVKVSLYQTSRSSTLYPLGIFMTALGENGKTFLDIYGGGYATSTTAGGFARPVLRIGNLAGLPDVGGKTPVGYGIYTSNGYFSGTIVSTSGKIANFTINGSKMYSNNHSAYNTATNGIYIGDDYISFGNGGVTYFNTSGTGKIGPWTLTTTALYNSKSSYNASVSGGGVYIGTDYIAGGNGEVWWLKKDGSAKIGAMTLSAAGVLTVPAANVSGQLTAATIGADKLTAGTIDSSILTSNNIVTDTITMGTAGSNAYIYVSKNNKSTAINSETKNWRIILGNVFGVSEAGYLTASSGKIGGFNLTTNAIYSTANALGTTANNVYLGTEGISLGTTFKVTKAGVLTATGVDISGAITSTSGFYVKTSSTGNYIAQMTGSGISLGNAGTNGSTYTTYNIQINPDTSTGGILLRKGTQVLNQIDSSGMTVKNTSGATLSSFTDNGVLIYDGNGSEDGNIIARFGSTATIGKSNNSHISLSENSFIFYDKLSNPFLKIEYLDEATSSTTTTKVNINISGTGTTTHTLTSTEKTAYNEGRLLLSVTYSPRIVEYADVFDVSSSGVVTIGFEAHGNTTIQLVKTLSATQTIATTSFTYGVRKNTKGSGSIVLGNNCEASGKFSLAEGWSTIASNSAAHAEGFSTTASGQYSHAEGNGSTASGNFTHAEGSSCTAGGTHSHAQGWGTIANGFCETAIGKYNVATLTNPATTFDASTSKYILVAGKGTSTARSNAMTLDWSGNLMITGSLSMANSGTTESITVSSSSNATKNISFSGFTSAPHVIATLVDASSTTHQLVVSVSNITATGAKINIRNNGTAQRSAKVSWIAIG